MKIVSEARGKLFFGIVACVSLLLAVPESTVAIEYQYKTIPIPQRWQKVEDLDISDKGEVIGNLYWVLNKRFYYSPRQRRGFYYIGKTFIKLMPPNFSLGLRIQSGAWDINNNGTVIGTVGSYSFSLPWGYYPSVRGKRIYLYEGGLYKILMPPGWKSLGSVYINDNGIVAGSGTDRNGISKGFIYNDGQYSGVLPPGWADATIIDINKSGVVVGNGRRMGNLKEGFIYNNGNYIEILPPGSQNPFITDINDNGVAVGLYRTDSGFSRGFIYNNGNYIRFPEQSYPPHTAKINNNGDVIAGQFLYSHGEFIDLLPPGWEWLFPTAINEKGTVIGYGGKNEFDTANFIYSQGVFEEINMPSLDLRQFDIHAINNNDDIVGVGYSLFTGSPQVFIGTKTDAGVP